MARVIFLSDLHLSPTHGFFWENWRLARDWANAQAPDRIVINGDLCINGPESDAEMAFAARELAGLLPPWHALPGNHDVGDEPPGQDAKQIIDGPRLARWQAAFGDDHFAVDAGAWRLVGLNAQLFGSGLPQEEAQFAFLVGELAAATKPVALVLHKPLFVDSPDEDQPSTASVTPAPRTRLMQMIRGSRVALVISGHLHAHRDVTQDGIRYLWLPATSFLHHGPGNGMPMVAVMTADFSAPTASVELVHLPGLVAYDLAALKEHGRYAFLRDRPECPPPVA
jgi:3',5'-cyclic AMP phosphodiesterase CpdA